MKHKYLKKVENGLEGKDEDKRREIQEEKEDFEETHEETASI